jgi:hypothetical protein
MARAGKKVKRPRTPSMNRQLREKMGSGGASPGKIKRKQMMSRAAAAI